MSREAHVRFCEGLRVKIPRSTRLHQKTVDLFRFIREHTDRFSVTKMCQVVHVSRSGYYQWIKYPNNKRKIEDIDLKQKIIAIYHNSLRIYKALLQEDYHMSKNGWYAITKK
jgi:hypothetical protein